MQFFKIVMLVLLPLPAIAEGAAVDQTFACLDQPIADNLAFNMCLRPLDLYAFEEVFDDMLALEEVANEIGRQSEPLFERVKNGWLAQEVDTFDQRLNRELAQLYMGCMVYEQNVEQNGDELALARCGMVTKFATLHFLYDNYYPLWGVTE